METTAATTNVISIQDSNPERFDTPTTLASVSLRKIPPNYLPSKVISLEDARNMYKYRVLRLIEDESPSDTDIASFLAVLQQEKEAVYRFAGRKFEEKLVEGAQGIECMKHADGKGPVNLYDIKDIYKMNGDKLEVRKAMYILQSRMWKENRHWALTWEKEYMQDEWKTEYLQPDEDTKKQSRQKGGCVKDCIVRKIADMVKSIQDIGDSVYGEHIGERQPKGQGQQFTQLDGGGYVVKTAQPKKKRKATSMASVIVTTVDDMSELTPNSLPTDQAMMVLQLLKRSGKFKDEDIRDMVRYEGNNGCGIRCIMYS
jgi:hypothetical protein